ncbi:MAG: hypothetical protein QG585_391 [Patescibacteria group bacterium]|nr:hypothetical protein [Patescibacteria group bacterium]
MKKTSFFQIRGSPRKTFFETVFLKFTGAKEEIKKVFSFAPVNQQPNHWRALPMKTNIIVALAAFLFSIIVHSASAATTAETVATLQAIATKEKDEVFRSALIDLGKAAQGQTLTPERTVEVKAKLGEMARDLRTAGEKSPNAADRTGFARDAAAIEAGIQFLDKVTPSEPKVVLPPSKYNIAVPSSTGDNFRDGIKRVLDKEITQKDWRSVVERAVAYIDGGNLGDNDLIEIIDKLDDMQVGLGRSSALTNVRVDKTGYMMDSKSVMKELLRQVEEKFAGTVPPAPSITVAPVTTAPSAPAPVAATKPATTKKQLTRPTPPAPARPAPKPATGHQGEEVAKAPPAPATK